MANIYTETHEIPYYECDVTGHLTLPMILNVVIKTSEAQSDSLSRGTDYLASYGLGWVITQHDITISKLPRVSEVVTVSTQATSYNKYFCYRDFWLHDDLGEELVHVQTTFVIIDLEKRKLTSVPDHVIDPFGSEKSTKIQRPLKFEIPEELTDKSYQVRFTDIDSNKHVNNTKYLEWLVDGLDYDFLVANEATKILMKFDKELYYGDEVLVSTHKQIDGMESTHRVSTAAGQSATAKINWQKR